jgi:hypothetical protein
MTRTQIKALVFVFVVLGLWRLFEIPAVASAFWAFCTVGAVPGTDQTLSPNLVLKMLIMAFPLCLLIIFRKEFLAAAPRRNSVRRKPATPKPKKSPVVIVLPIKSRTPLRARFAKIDRVVGVIMDIEARFIVKLIAKTRQAVYIAGRYLWEATLMSGHIIAMAAALCGRICLRLWGLSEPYIREFDQWLNVTLHKNRTIAYLLDLGSELGRLAGASFHKVAAYTQHRPVRKP